jgi:hypothetical protein
VAAGEERDQDLANDPLLSDDGARELAFDSSAEVGDFLERRRRHRGMRIEHVAEVYYGSIGWIARLPARPGSR